MDNFDLTALLAKLFSKYGSSSVIDAEAIENPDDPTQFNLVVSGQRLLAKRLSKNGRTSSLVEAEAIEHLDDTQFNLVVSGHGKG